MLLRRVTALPEGTAWSYEVKWDGYRMRALTDFQPLICGYVVCQRDRVGIFSFFFWFVSLLLRLGGDRALQECNLSAQPSLDCGCIHYSQ